MGDCRRTGKIRERTEGRAREYGERRERTEKIEYSDCETATIYNVKARRVGALRRSNGLSVVREREQEEWREAEKEKNRCQYQKREARFARGVEDSHMFRIEQKSGVQRVHQ